MSAAELAILTRPRLQEFFRSAFKPETEWQVGMELEKMGRIVDTGLPIPYDGESASVVAVLRHYQELRGGFPIFEAEHLIGLDGPYGTISLEPAGQVEWSSRPHPTLDELDHQLVEHLKALDRAGSAAGVDWLDVAVDPVHDVSEMPWMPKARYGIMKPYMGARGRLSHRMMTQTASIQCAFDFRDEEDWVRKFRAAALTAPISVALFANSARVDGRDSGFRSYRQAIWKETDPDRTGLPAVVFDPAFDLDHWIDFICDVPSMFHRRARGLVPAGGVPFRRMMERTTCEAPRMEDWELHLSSVFTEVRSYAYIEVRSADLLPDEVAFAVPSFWTGLLYNEANLSAALELGTDIDDQAAWRQAMDSAAKSGLDGTIGGRPIRDRAERLLEIIGSAYRDGQVPCGGGNGAALRSLEMLADRHGIRLTG
ncbi:MAG: hypothetical protein IFK94_02930 [Acidobacteria bacterium]|uniref:Glutamate--cysteine ligase n=1 Tax=Candidatus Polarisedimenticola svalbardensis TaxID=2886004 RepID=A0A8J6Y4J4_9BACT|nr:hypothetical protein [Candidatus Polarisedimenticola svalbardensis]